MSITGGLAGPLGAPVIIPVAAPASDGLIRPLNAPATQPVTPGVQPGVSGQVVYANLVIIYGDNGGLFVYAPSPGAGNLLVSIAAEAGVDQYGNSYPQGLFVAAGIIEGSIFEGTDFIIDSSGIFFYST